MLDETHTIPNKKLHKINQIITQIYGAENKTRSFFLLRNRTYFTDYLQTLDLIGANIDSLKHICKDSPEEVSRLDTIKLLLDQKKDINRQLSALKSNTKRDKLYDRAFEEVYIQAYELSKLSRIVQEKVVITRDSLVVEPEKKNLMQRVKNVFSQEKPKADKNKMVVERSSKTDTVLQEGLSADSVVKSLQQTLKNLRIREDYVQSQSLRTEMQLLYNDQVLLDKIREIATLLETDEIQRINHAINSSSGILQQASDVAVALVAISVFVIVVFLFLIFRDITLGKKHQLELRTAKQQTEELMRLKEQFLANMSHEIRSPLGTIIGFTEQLQKTRLSIQQQQFTNTIDRASSHLLDVVNDILDLSKIEAGKLALEKVPFNLHKLLRDVCDSFSLKTKEKNIGLHCQIDKDLDCELNGDPFRIQQVMINILSNAVKFTNEGHITLRAEVFFKDQSNIGARISVTDTGIGIPKEKQKEIFDDFLQVDTGTARKYGGTGLGLSISRRIVQLHGGSMQVESEVGQGSTFTIDLPLEVPAEMVQEVQATSPDRQMVSLKGKQILTIEDDEVTLLLIRSLLTDAGVNAEAMTDPVKAIETIGKKQFDLVLTDIHMPNMSGIDFIRAVRSSKDKKVSKLPVIALTANVTVKNELLKEGFTDYLSKPFKEASFYKIIISVLNPGTVPKVEDATEAPCDCVGSTYSLEEIYAFTGDDEEALRLVVSTFVEKSMTTVSEIKNFVKAKDIEGISFRAHRLLPSFRQFHIWDLVPKLEKLERYQEINLPADNFFAITSEVTKGVETIVKQIEEEVVISKTA